jgi:hypothetical protein
MNPVVARFVAVIFFITIGAIGLLRYVTSRGDSMLQHEIERANKLGWLKAPKETAPAYEVEVLDAVSKAYQSIPSSSPSQAIHFDPFIHSTTTAQRTKAIEQSQRAAELLSQILPTLETAVERPFITVEHRFAERFAVCRLFVQRALALEAEGRPEAAFGSLTLASHVAGILAPKSNMYLDEMDELVRTAWVKLAVKHPTYARKPLMVAPAAGEHLRNQVVRLLRLNVNLEDMDGLKSNEKRERYQLLKNGNDLFSTIAATPGAERNPADEYQTLRAAQGMGIARDSNTDLLFRTAQNRAARHEICATLVDVLKPTALAKTKDPFGGAAPPPLKFVTRPDGFNLYSIGPDGGDSGGNHGDISVKVTKGAARTDLGGLGRWR